MNIKQATEKWVGEFNAIPMALIEKAYPDFYDEVEVLATDLECEHCGSTEYNSEGADNVEDDDILTCMNCGENDFQESYGLPMWGTMWTFYSVLDEEWARKNVEVMRECGFWVYESDELGIFFGINGAGYDFYEDHWIPLYKSRGLHWHSEE